MKEMMIQSVQNKTDEHEQNWINHLDITDEGIPKTDPTVRI
jgi:hypothetical protein